MAYPNIDQVMNNLSHSLQLRGKRANVLANNIANQNTPGFKAQDLDFSSQLSGLLPGKASTPQQTNARHILVPGNEGAGLNYKYRVPNQANINGNTVDTQVEQADFTQNAIEYKAILAFLNHEINNLNTVIKGS